MSLLVDCHAHLQNELFDDLDAVIGRAKKAGVKAIINAALDDNERVLKLAKKYDIIKPALGVHPNYINDSTMKKLDSVIKYPLQNKFCLDCYL